MAIRLVTDSASDITLAEAKKLGFTVCVLPKANADTLQGQTKIKVIGVSNVQEAIDLI